MIKSYLQDSINERVINGHKINIQDKCILVDNKKLDLNNYEIMDFLGNGANGVVFRAIEKISDMECAIKIWLPDSKRGKSNITRSNKEIKKISKLNHPNIVRYFSTGEVSKYHYCVLEKINGLSLERYIDKKHPRLAIRYDILEKILEGLRVAHEKNIFHGDLHSDNILIQNDGSIKILDFGTSVFGKGYSLARDSRLLYSTSMKILGEYIDRNIILLKQHEIETLSPKVIRLIAKATSKIAVLLDFSKYGITDTVIEDIALFAMIVPFFNLKYIAELINECKSDKSHEANFILYTNRLIQEGGKRIDFYNMYEECNSLVEENLYEFYSVIRNKFIKLVEKYDEEKYIYYDVEEAKLFNQDLYLDRIGLYKLHKNLEQKKLDEMSAVLEGTYRY